MSLKINKIFIVDDDEMLSEMLMDHLSRGNLYDIKIFDTGEKCLENLHENPDLVILDFNLNSKYKDAANGLQILQELTNVNKEIVVIMYSSQEQSTSAINSIGNSAVRFVIKDQHAFLKIEQIINSI